ncbi:MAG: magnesium and cobalt transport protein CorA [Sphingobacteriia bacterium]|nr:MAG: magnesium and cobalt transport protein CorA [Sphingobacteriia bacterium]TAG29658.1 MAG: magnesium and cobalt transport protein CorA [Sphingobacteriia bacterium]TAH07594.1 MAG: magnesium and cobalt transport protein CorA [Sphingobacteriia bacterium]
MTGNKYLKYLNVLSLFNTNRTRDIFKVNPTVTPIRQEADQIVVNVFNYSPSFFEEKTYQDISNCFSCKNNQLISWINIDGIRKKEVEDICIHFGIHALITEDILSIDQRPKMDEIDPVLYCLLNMLYFNEQTGAVETEQISIILGKEFVVSFQEDAKRDVFNPIREKLKIANSKLRQNKADYLCYAMLDMIVDHYYLVMEKIGERIELLEEKIIRSSNTRSLAEINALRKELIVLKRNVSPVRELISGFIRSESELLEDKTTKYFKDVYDHIVQANDLAESYRDMMINLQDLYLSNVNLKMNEVMKVMAIVTCLLAPATVIGGIFGMNFDKLPYIHHEYGFYIAAGLMTVVPIIMVFIFRKRGWF